MVRELKTIDRIIVALNMIVYRVDALLNNFIDGVFLLSYSIALALTMRYKIEHGNVWAHVISLSVLLHMFYMVVYVINDAIDHKRKWYLKPSIDESFYQLRPVYYFRGSRTIITYFALIYTMIIILTSMFSKIPFLQLIIFVVIIVSLAFLHLSRNIALRVITFYLLRIVKYTYLLMLLHIVTFNQLYKDVFILSILSLVTPYVTYTTLDYTKHFSSKPITGVIVLTISAFLISLLLLESIVSGCSLIELIRVIVVSYTFVVIPVLAIRQGLRKHLGAYNPRYYHHLLRLALGAVLVSIVLLLVLNLLAMLHPIVQC